MSKAIQGAAMLGLDAAMYGALAFGTAGMAMAVAPLFNMLAGPLLLGGISMEAGAIASALSSNRGTGITMRQPACFRQVLYGERRLGGVEVYRSTTGSQHDQFNYVIVVTGHEVGNLINLYLDGRQVYWLGSGPGYVVRNGIGFGGVADNANHTGPDGQQYNFGGTGHSGIYCSVRFGDQTDPAGTDSAGPDFPPGSPSVIGELTANDANWAADGLGNYPWVAGCCYIYLKIEFNPDLFPSEPEIKITVQGKNDILDPRTGTTGYTSNWALIVNDILTNSTFGLGDLGSVNQAQLIAAANVCDEQVDLAIGGTEARYAAHWMFDTSVSPGDQLQNLMGAAGGRLSRIGGQWYIWPAYWTGPTFDFDASVLTGDLGWNPYRSLRELANRVEGTYIAANYPWNVAGNLYDSNGFFNGRIANNFPFAFQPTSYPMYAQDVLHGYAEDLLLEADSGVRGAWSSATTYDLGDVVTEAGVIYKSLAPANLNNDPAVCSAPTGAASVYASGTTYAAGAVAAYTSAPISITGDMVSGNPLVTSVSSTTGLVVGQAISGTGIQAGAIIAAIGSGTVTLSAVATATGTSVAITVTPASQIYISLVGSNTGNQPDMSPTDWAPVVWVQYSNALPLELSFNSVLSIGQAQRLAKIALLRNRQQGNGTFPMHLRAWRMQPLDVFTMEFPQNNWAAKVLEVVSTRFYLEQQKDGAQAVRFEIQAQETDPSIYEWSTAEELSVYDVPNTLPSLPYTLGAPTGLTLLSNSSTAYNAGTGVLTPQVLVSWTAPADVRVTQIQIQYQAVGAGTWEDFGAVSVATSAALINTVVNGTQYDVQIRSLGNNGAVSAWVSAGPVTATSPNSAAGSYANVSQYPLTNPTSTSIAVAATAVTFGAATVNYAARTLTITAPGSPTWYYLTIADPTQAGESGSPTLTATASTSNSLVGVQGNTYLGAILALPAGGTTEAIPGGWPAPTGFQVVG